MFLTTMLDRQLRVFSLVLLICVTCQAAKSRAQAADSATRGMVTRITIDSQRYCEGDGQINMLQLHLQAEVTNRTGEPAVMYLGSPMVEQIAVAKHESALRIGRLEANITPFEMTATSTEPVLNPRHFITFAPDASHTVDRLGTIALPVVAKGSQLNGVLSPGEHVLALRLAVWSDGVDVGPWAKRVASRGRLWVEPLVSLPVRLHVENEPSLIKCEKSDGKQSGM